MKQVFKISNWFFIALLPTVHLFATDGVVQGNLEVTGISTLRMDAYLEGTNYFGKLPMTGNPGFSIVVDQEVSNTEVEEITPGYYQNITVSVAEYGYLTTPTQTWVEEFGYYNIQVWIDEWGYYYPEVWYPDTYSYDGQLITPGYWATGTSPTWSVIGGHLENQQIWGVVGGHYESLGGLWGVTGSHEEVQSVWMDPVHSSYTSTTYGIPQAKFISQVDDMAWSFNNLGRKIAEITNAGLSIPLPGDAQGSSRAMFTPTQFEQSYTTPAVEFGDYVSYGVRVAKDGIHTWEDYGEEQVVHQSTSSKLKPSELVIQKKIPNSSDSTATVVGTRIGATDAQFGGLVKVTGPLLVNPQGDLTMGIYTNGPKP